MVALICHICESQTANEDEGRSVCDECVAERHEAEERARAAVRAFGMTVPAPIAPSADPIADYYARVRAESVAAWDDLQRARRERPWDHVLIRALSERHDHASNTGD